MRIGIIDSGLRPDFQGSVLDSRKFKCDSLGNIHAGFSCVDALGHGTSIANLIVEQSPKVDLLVAQIFTESRVATVSEVIEAIKWLAANEVHVINMSFGLTRFNKAFHVLCKEIVDEHDLIMLASAPSCGGVVFPAGFGSCVSVSGDIRCNPSEFSWLGTTRSDFGAHPFLVEDKPHLGGGASYACARFCAVVASKLAAGIPQRDVMEHLKSSASYCGPQETPRYVV